MSDEMKLNPASKEFESSLKSTVLPPVGFNRDELMYQAGWAAAVADGATVSIERLDRSATPLPQPSIAWAWPTAALFSSAAAILLASMLMFPSDSPTNSDGVAERAAEILLQIGTNSNVEIVDTETPSGDSERSQVDESYVFQRGAFSRQRNVVALVMSMKPGQILTSGLGIQGSPVSFELAPGSVGSGSENQASGLNQRQMLNELLAPAEPFENTRL
ncbi:MAG: putative small integral membrane protein [Mariniblastus sp.]|jgi:predicted small integral membrane protein